MGCKKGSVRLGLGRVDEHGNDCRFGQQFAQQLQPLRSNLHIQISHTRHVAAGSVQAGDKPNIDRVDRYREDESERSQSPPFAAIAEGVPPAATISVT